ncbi:MAG: hypothetical protein HGB17_08475, partial [Syntrophobacteraceae bacterium]|nr:hypothetical protein [Syntrophobacteraceae bacterium]
MRATIVTHMDVGRSGLRSLYPRQAAGVRIDDDAYLGAGCTVLPGVSIGSHALVAAGAEGLDKIGEKLPHPKLDELVFLLRERG